MLLVFAFSITPRLFLHDLFAGHVDNAGVKHSKASYQISASGFNCDKDGVVATSPFVADEHALNFQTLIFLSSFKSGEIPFSSAGKIYSPLRGPPASPIC